MCLTVNLFNALDERTKWNINKNVMIRRINEMKYNEIKEEFSHQHKRQLGTYYHVNSTFLISRLG